MMAQYQAAVPYPGISPFPDRVIKRPMTAPEGQKLVKLFKNLQKVLRGLSPVPLLFAFLDLFVLPSLPQELSIFFYVIQLVFVLVVLALAGGVFSLRKKTAAALKEGLVYEISGIARRSQQKNKNVAGWTVGPVTLSSNRAKPLSLQEGMPATLVCVPKTGGLLSLNNADAENGWVKCPPDIDRYVSAQAGAPAPLYQPMPGAQYGTAPSSYAQPQPQPQYQPQPRPMPPQQYAQQPQPPAPQQPAWPVYQPPSQPAAQYPPYQPQSYQQPQQFQPQPQFQQQPYPQPPQPMQYPAQPQPGYARQYQPPVPEQPYQPPLPPAGPPQYPPLPPGQK
jgi:hypothetical protein